MRPFGGFRTEVRIDLLFPRRPLHDGITQTTGLGCLDGQEEIIIRPRAAIHDTCPIFHAVGLYPKRQGEVLPRLCHSGRQRDMATGQMNSGTVLPRIKTGIVHQLRLSSVPYIRCRRTSLFVKRPITATSHLRIGFGFFRISPFSYGVHGRNHIIIHLPVVHLMIRISVFHGSSYQGIGAAEHASATDLIVSRPLTRSVPRQAHVSVTGLCFCRLRPTGQAQVFRSRRNRSGLFALPHGICRPYLIIIGRTRFQPLVRIRRGGQTSGHGFKRPVGRSRPAQFEGRHMPRSLPRQT